MRPHVKAAIDELDAEIRDLIAARDALLRLDTGPTTPAPTAPRARHHGQPMDRCFRCGRDYHRGQWKKHEGQCRPPRIPDRILKTLQLPPGPKARRS